MKLHQANEKWDEAIEELSREEMEILLSGVDERQYSVDVLTAKRIEEKTMAKMNTEKPKRKRPRARFAIAASIAIFAAAVLFAEPVQAAILNFFSVVPGFGIVENSDELYYTDDVVITDENGILMEDPTLSGSGNGIQLLYRYHYDSAEKPSSTSRDFEQILTVNGEVVAEIGDDVGNVWGNGEAFLRTSFHVNVSEGDRISYSDANGVMIEGILKKAAAVSADTLASTKEDKVIIYADVQDGGEVWNIFLHVTTLEPGMQSTKDSLMFRDDLFLRLPDESEIPIQPPFTAGSGFELPYTVSKGEFESATLIVPKVSYEREAQKKVVVPVPTEDAGIEINKEVEIEGGVITIHRILPDHEFTKQLNEGVQFYAVEFSLKGNTDPLLDIRMNEARAGEIRSNGSIAHLIPIEEGQEEVSLLFYNPAFLIEKDFEIPIEFPK